MVFPHVDIEDFRKLLFWLNYHRPPDGTGTTLTRQDLLNMEFEEIVWTSNFLTKQWDAETNANRKAARR